MANSNYLHELPFYNITTCELIEDLYATESIKHSMYSSFYNDIVTVCDSEVLKQLKFSYSSNSECNRLVHGKNIELSVFHINIRSSNKKHAGLMQLLQLYNVDFDVLILSEVWNYNLEFYINIFLNVHYCAPALGKVGGIGIFVKIPYVCSEITSLKLPTSPSCPVESLWLEMDNSTCKYL